MQESVSHQDPGPMRQRIIGLALTALLALVATFATSPEAVAQSRPAPESLSRATEKGEGGRVEWVKHVLEHKDNRCRTCKGKGKAVCEFCKNIGSFTERETCPECDHPATNDREKPNLGTCRVCIGTGYYPDFLEKAPCPGCFGGAVVPCPRCVGSGGFGTSGDDKAHIKCTVCKGSGFFACTVCKGERLVDMAKLKPSLAEAKVKDLEKAQKALDAVAKSMKKLRSASNARKDAKAWASGLRAGYKYFPVLKTAASQASSLAKSHAKDPNAQGNEQMVYDAFEARKLGLELYLGHQRRMIELALERAKHNESLD